jgi:hypothetical protein
MIQVNECYRDVSTIIAPEPEFLHASAQPKRAHYRPMSDPSASLMQFLRGSVYDQLSPESYISGLDDKPATAFTLGQLRDTFGRTGETHDVKVLRAGKRTSIAVAVAVVSIDQRSL